jgi:hypothetical protein
MKKSLVMLLIFILNGKISNFAQMKQHADTVKIGFYITSFRNIDFESNKYNADMWLWLNYKYHDAAELKNMEQEKFDQLEPWFEWLDAIDENQGGQPAITRFSQEIDSAKHIIWKTLKISAPFYKKWDLTKYPFDKQNITISVESADYESEKRIIVPDTLLIDPNFINNEKEWIFSNFRINDTIINYATSFGNPKKFESTEYSRISLNFDITRQNKWVTFFKLFIGILISFLIALSVFYIRPINLDARFGLCVGGLFSAVGSKYIVDGIIPVKYQNTLFDYIHNVTFFYILLITAISILSLKFYESNEIRGIKKSKKIDEIGLLFCSTTYFSIILLLVYFTYKS